MRSAVSLAAASRWSRKDGVVLGDSELDGESLSAIENHSDRPEIQRARQDGLGVARRYSTTVRADLLYVAVPVDNPALPSLGFVRLALPLTDVAEQLRIGLAIRPGGVRHRARRGPRAVVGDIGVAQPASPGDCGRRGTLRARRLVTPGARLRQ